MPEQGLAGQLHRLSDGILGDAAVPLLNNGLPGHTLGHLLEHVRNQDPRATKGGLAVADPGIGHNVTSHQPGFWCWLHVHASKQRM